MSKLRVGILGATGMVGQRFVVLLQQHAFFELTCLAASSQSAGKTYSQALAGRWAMSSPVPETVASLVVYNAANIAEIAAQVDLVFCAVDMSKEETLALEEAYARAEVPVVSNNSAARGLDDVPMLIPEINAGHSQVIDSQRKRLGSKRGFIAVKPNCSIQSYVPALEALRGFGLKEVSVCTYQAISGAGKTFETWPEMIDNVIPFIKGEEEKSELEPLKIWGVVKDGKIVNAQRPLISAQCIRVSALDGHLAAVSVRFDKKPSREQIIDAWQSFKGPAGTVDLPLAPRQFINYFEQDNRPQTKLDRDLEGGMAISVGRLRQDSIFDYKFVCLSHNTVRGAAGGAVLMAELLYTQGYLSLAK